MKGKQAAAAARRRYESSIEHLDRVTDQLVEAKARAKTVEAAAARVPVLEAELTALRQQVADLEGPQKQRADRLTAELHDERETRQEDTVQLRRFFRRALRHGRLEIEHYEEIARLLGFSNRRLFMSFLLYGNTTFVEDTESFGFQVRQAMSSMNGDYTVEQRVNIAVGIAVDYLDDPSDELLEKTRTMFAWAFDESVEQQEADTGAVTPSERLALAAQRHERVRHGHLR